MQQATQYGRRKLDEAAYAEQEAQSAATAAGSEGGTVYGSRKLDGPAQPAASATVNPFLSQADANGNGRVTLAELSNALYEKPELLDLAIEAEVADGKPRVGAIALFRDIEQLRDGGPRTDVIAVLDQLTAE